jgi:hypothetical protein
MDPQQPAQKLPIVEHPELFETFADSISATFFDGTTLRIEFTVTRWEETGAAQPTAKRHVTSRLVLSAAGAADLVKRMQQIAGAMIQSGAMQTDKKPSASN